MLLLFVLLEKFQFVLVKVERVCIFVVVFFVFGLGLYGSLVVLMF